MGFGTREENAVAIEGKGRYLRSKPAGASGWATDPNGANVELAEGFPGVALFQLMGQLCDALFLTDSLISGGVVDGRTMVCVAKEKSR